MTYLSVSKPIPKKATAIKQRGKRSPISVHQRPTAEAKPGTCFHMCSLPMQPKLKIGSPNDKYEQEADRVAEQVMRMPESQLQQPFNPLNAQGSLQTQSKEPAIQRRIDEDEEMVQPLGDTIQRLCTACEDEETLQRMEMEEEDVLQAKHKSSQISSMTPTIQTGINRLRQSGGTAIPASTRAFMEPRFGYDFSKVKIHAGPEAANLSQAINARAFTVGHDIFFNQGEFRPRNQGRQKLLAHELAHVVQQTSGLRKEVINRREQADSSASSAGAHCPMPPEPMDEWRTEPWLCNMRRSSIGDNSFLLAAKGQRGAKGDAQGRSVELVHQVLTLWLCENPEIGSRYSLPSGDRYTSSTVAVVKEFQQAFDEIPDGIVGPATLNLMDFYINGAPVPSPPDCTGRSEVCGPRDTTEEVDSGAENLVLEENAPKPTSHGKEVQVLRLSGFTVDEASLEKGPDKVLDRLAKLLPLGTLRPHKIGKTKEINCWEVEKVDVYGFSDCHESPSLGLLRAETVRDNFPEAGMIIGVPSAPASKNLTLEQRRFNRSVLLFVTFQLTDTFDFMGSDLDALLDLFKRERKTLEGTYENLTIDVAALLANGANDEYLDTLDAKLIAEQKYPSDCFFDLPWNSARSDLGQRLVVDLDAQSLCISGTTPTLDEFMVAVANSVVTPISQGINKLALEAARAAISSDYAGCACIALKDLLIRSKNSSDIYYAFNKDLSDVIDPSESCRT